MKNRCKLNPCCGDPYDCEPPIGLLPQVLRARGKNNTLYDINRAADFIEAALSPVQEKPKESK